MKIQKLILFFCASVLIVYFIFGLFFLDIPIFFSDEAWILSRVHFFSKYHYLKEIIYPPELSPYLAGIYNASAGNQFVGIIKLIADSFFFTVLPIDDLYSLRIASFAWSVLVCFLTFKLAKKLGYNNQILLVSVTLLIIVPQFFDQLHKSDRSELVVTAAFLAGLLLFTYTLKTEDILKKRILFFFSGIYAWMMAIMTHPNAVIIPVTFCCLYLYREYKRFISINTILLGASMLAGLFYFYYVMYSQVEVAKMSGGGSPTDSEAPPIIKIGISIFYHLPMIFYRKLAGNNLFAQPVSLLFFLISLLSYLILFRNEKYSEKRYIINILGIAIIIPLMVLTLLSGSTGNYLVIFFPLCAILIAAAFDKFIVNSESKVRLKYIIIGILCILFLSDFYGMSKQNSYAKEYRRVMEEVSQAVPKTEAVLALRIYYPFFMNQPFYGDSWLNPNVGKQNQSFSSAVKAVNVKYLIIDNIFIYRAISLRGKLWSESMFDFLNENCKMIKEIETNYYYGLKNSKVPEKLFFKEIKIYKVIY